MQGFVNTRHHGLELDSASGTLTFQGYPVSPQSVLELLDAPVEVVADSGVGFTLQTIHRMFRRYPNLMLINSFAQIFMQQADSIRPRFGVVGAQRPVHDELRAMPLNLTILKITEVHRAELTHKGHEPLMAPTPILSGSYIASFRLLFEDRPSMDVEVETRLQAVIDEEGAIAPIDDFYLADLYQRPIHLLPGMMIDVHYPATAERLGLDMDRITRTDSTLEHSDLTLADLCHTCLSINFMTSEERLIAKQEDEQNAQFMERMQRLMDQYIEGIEEIPGHGDGLDS